MVPSIVEAFGKKSADTLLAFFEAPTKVKLNDRLESAIYAAINGIEANDDGTVGTGKYLQPLKDIQGKLKKQSIVWSDWVTLTKKGPTQKSLNLALPIQEIAGRYECHRDLQNDIRDFCKILFLVAAKALDGFQALKESGGLIDFVDQEHLLLNALDNDSMRRPLSREIDLLLVDEFQDTSLIQLALFLKLAKLAQRTIFVGDIKQAVYGFRGADPELMHAVIREIETSGGRIEVLPDSWRSRPGLVRYANEVFVPAFDSLLSEDKVILNPKRKEIAKQTVVETWILEGSNKELIDGSLSVGIAKLMESGHVIIDKSTGEQRPVRYGDIAVLSRTNKKVTELSDVLSSSGIPIKLARKGLLSTPEVCLASACLRRLSDRSDTLASAEIISLSDCSTVETWLEERLAYLADGNPSYSWRETGDNSHPILKALGQQRDRLKYLTPVEALSLAVNTGEVRRTVVSWGVSELAARQRFANIDAFIKLAEDYEEHCRSQHLAATVSGMQLWMTDMAADGEDMQAVDTSADAVHLLTHHSAKGLEWPVVILTDLEGNVWSKLWDLSVVADMKQFSLEDPLENRRLRYWPKPFGKHSKGINLFDKVGDSEVAKTVAESDIAEHIRLLSG
jgi:ATP-dependent helicase/nuclease subunit A